MSRQRILKLVLFALFFVIPALASSSDIEFSLPDSLKDLRFWNNTGQFVGKNSTGGPHPIPLIVVTPESSVAGDTSVYRIDITLPKDGIPYSGGMAFGFPHGFNLGGISRVDYSDNYEGPDLTIKNVFVVDGIFSIFFKKGISPPQGTIVTLKIHSITNNSHAGTYQIAGVIFNKSIVVVAGPTPSERFSIIPRPAVTLEVQPSEPLVLRAGESQRFIATAHDSLGNEITGLQIQWSFSPEHDSIGILTDGQLLALKVGIGQVKASYESTQRLFGIDHRAAGGDGSFLIDRISTVHHSRRPFSFGSDSIRF